MNNTLIYQNENPSKLPINIASPALIMRKKLTGIITQSRANNFVKFPTTHRRAFAKDLGLVMI